MRTVWLNGRLLPEEEARISPFDRGFLLGDAVFETMRAYGGRPFRVEEHLARLRRSCEVARLPFPEEARGALADVLRANGLADAALRVTVSRGPGGRGASPRGAGPPTVLVTATAVEPRPEVWSRGLRLATARLPRPQGLDPGVKTTNYLVNVLAKAQAEDAGADDALFVDADGLVVEATQANVFAVLRDRLVTPPLSSGCLPGVTRAALLDLAPDAGLRAAEAALPREALLEADEVFLSASVLEVGPVVALDGLQMGGGRPGPVARRLHALYRKAAGGQADAGSKPEPS
ncbi:MAG TPA: aminotransferase class IV [Candidatus Thermoplasmatota archaeon]|nr:aminotransferase class IV [Candidatus Thermoplasmatota archaeon]